MANAEASVVILVEDLYEDLELWYPLLRLREEGATVSVVGPSAGQEYKGKHGYPVVSDAAPEDIAGMDLDAVIVPGGYAPDRIRRHPGVRFSDGRWLVTFLDYVPSPRAKRLNAFSR